MCRTSSTTSPGSCSDFSTFSCTSRPTIRRDISSTEVEATSTVPMYLPFRRMVHRSATALISASLWVMNRMLFPSALKPRMISISSSIS